MTRAHLQRARDIADNPNVAVVVPVTRRFAWFIPAATIQLRGRAQLVDGTDEAGTRVFRGFWMVRRILHGYSAARRRGETPICFLKITLDPVVRTYMLGVRVWQLRQRMEEGAGKAVLQRGCAPWATARRP